MSKAKPHKPDDSVLRASDVLPPFDATGGNPKKHKRSLSKREQKDNGSPESADRAKGSGLASDDTAAVPSFDLADDIMAEHRRRVAARRKRPGWKDSSDGSSDSGSASQRHSIGLDSWESPEQRRIISEIVARDIAGLLAQSAGEDRG